MTNTSTTAHQGMQIQRRGWKSTLHTLMGHKVPGVQAVPILEGEDARMFAFMQKVRQNRGQWEKNANRKRMLAKGHYRG